MNIIDKTLYHQIHPFKLSLDFLTGILSIVLVWFHHLVWGVVIAFGPSLLASFVMIRTMDFEKQKRSKFGKYVKKYMGKGSDSARSIGFLIMGIGAWFHMFWVILGGFILIITAWLNGLLPFRRSSNSSRAGNLLI
ncbi:MAG: hypothetical protein ACP5US_02135 [Candidatus Kryptoniota bacterium]